MHQRFGRDGVKLNMFTVGNDCARLVATRCYRREICGSAFFNEKDAERMPVLYKMLWEEL